MPHGISCSFLQAVTLDHAKTLLRDASSILDASYEVGLSGPGRLHDLFVTHEAMSPGIYKSKGAGLSVFWGFRVEESVGSSCVTCYCPPLFSKA